MLEDGQLLDDGYDDNGSERSWGTAITVGGTTYATSLFWQPLQNPSDPMQEIEETSAAVLEGSDLFCIKSGRAPQFGICVSQEGYKSGQYVAACSLVTAIDNLSSFIAVFRTNEGWWYTCVRNDIILSDGDMLFLSEEEAKNQFMSMLAVPDWGMKIAPREWGLEGTEDVSLADLLQRGARAKLQKIKGLRGTKLLVIVVLSLVVGGWLVSSLIDKLLFTPVKKPVVVPIRPKPVVQEQEIKPIPKPWENLLDPHSVMNNCYEAVKQLTDITPPGWTIGQITCTGTSAATAWSRGVGFMSIAEEAIARANVNFAAYGFDDSGNNLTASINLPPPDIIESAPAYSMLNLRNILNNEFQTMNLPISLSAISIQVPSGQPNVPPANFNKMKFSFTSPHNPLTWMSYWAKYPALEINLITYSPSGDMWYYEGDMYVL
ncbi:MAG: type 4b pilus protein PilO2 [Alphaproteobacteria bacterium]|nr:type 4b pilus protein PilO2 [Alphaproteobacteria bacterium]